MYRVRKTIALAALLTFAGLIVAVGQLPSPGGGERKLGLWVLLLPLAVTFVGLARNRYWGRWLGLAAGIAVLPWAAVLTLATGYGAPLTQPAIALAASLLLLMSLPGKNMFDAYEGRVTNMDWSHRRMSLVRWTVIFNIASALALYLFVVFYDYRLAWHHTSMGVLLLGLVVGVVMLARQQTVGLLLVALCCLLFVPLGAYFVWTEATDPGEAILFAVVFAPGILTGWASLLVFAKPLWAALRSAY